ncbi:MAG: 50S ribosomal protein L6 [Candidatus Pelagibacterales bacterium]|jgi:large subunit ribosomal protein L6|tara:strand:- start:172 stop:705 length:534 start_codon:yes stop_codon:yes gene_type:complete
MSRVGSKIITVPDNVKIFIENGMVHAEGPKGKLSTKINDGIDVNITDKEVTCLPRKKDRQSLAFWGLQRNLVNNIVIGVGEGFTKKLEMNGVGYRAAVQGTTLELLLGFSHPIKYPIPQNLEIKVDKQNNIEIFGADKQLVGQVAAEIRSFRGPEPYKGKGIKYSGEFIVRKEGKKK